MKKTVPMLRVNPKAQTSCRIYKVSIKRWSEVTVNSAVVQARSKICNDVRHRRCYDLHQGESERSKTHRL